MRRIRGRFLSTDPFPGWSEEPLSLSAFSYAHANPTRYTDPTGEWVHIAAGAGICAAIGCGAAIWTEEDCWKGAVAGGLSGGAVAATFGLALAATREQWQPSGGGAISRNRTERGTTIGVDERCSFRTFRAILML